MDRGVERSGDLEGLEIGTVITLGTFTQDRRNMFAFGSLVGDVHMAPCPFTKVMFIA